MFVFPENWIETLYNSCQYFSTTDRLSSETLYNSKLKNRGDNIMWLSVHMKDDTGNCCLFEKKKVCEYNSFTRWGNFKSQSALSFGDFATT